MPRRVALLAAAVVLFAPAARAEDKAWSAVILATNYPSGKAPPEKLRDYLPRLKRVFGYKNYELIGSATETIADKSSLRLAPTQSFTMAIKARRASSK
jgi:hypothetical protein